MQTGDGGNTFLKDKEVGIMVGECGCVRARAWAHTFRKAILFCWSMLRNKIGIYVDRHRLWKVMNDLDLLIQELVLGMI